MKSAGFYMSIVASEVVLTLCMAWMSWHLDYLHTGQDFYRNWISIAMYGSKVIAALAPVSMMMYFREHKWVRNLFLFTAGVDLILAVYALQSLTHVSIPLVWRSLVLLFTFAGAITFVGGCFSVQTSRIRTGFRWLAVLYLLQFLAVVIWGVIRIQHTAYFRNFAVPYLITLPAYILLFFLCYRSGETAPAQDQWEAAVDSIGSPEEEADS